MTDPSVQSEKFTRAFPKLQRIWSAHSLEALMRCPRYYQYRILEGWDRRNDTLNFGSWYHEALEVYDKARLNDQPVDEALDCAIDQALILTGSYTGKGKRRKWLPWESLDNRRTTYTLIRAIVWFVDEFGSGAVQPYMFPDGTPAIELSFSIPLPLDTPDNEPYILYGFLDGLVNFGVEIYVRERKTTVSTVSGHYFKRFAPNVQINTYDLVCEFMFPDLDVRGVMLEAVQTGVTMSRAGRHLVNRTPSMREEWLKDLLLAIQSAERYAEADYWPMNPSACSIYGGCPYRGICSKDPVSRERFLAADFERSL